MTYVTGTQTEVLYVMPANGAALATSSTKTLISGNTTTNPPYILNLATLWQPSYVVGRALRVVARGTFGTTGTPTLTIACSADTTQGTQGVTLAATGALTAPSSITNGNWELEFGVDFNSLGATGGTWSTSIDAVGKFVLGAGNNAATAAATAYMVGSATSITTLLYNTSYFIELYATWGTSSASNTIQCLQFEIFGLN